VDQLENKHIVKQKKHILDHLSERIPSIPFINWIRNVVISQHHLESVFETDLTVGIKNCIQDYFTECKKNKQLIPICSFVEKSNTIYIYESEKLELQHSEKNTAKWRTVTNADIDKMIAIISFKFLQAFIEWKKNINIADVSSSYLLDDENISEELRHKNAIQEQIKQQQQTYMIKINGQRVNEDKRRNEIKQLVYAHVQLSLPSITDFS
jgi:hypothetical protein